VALSDQSIASFCICIKLENSQSTGSGNSIAVRSCSNRTEQSNNSQNGGADAAVGLHLETAESAASSSGSQSNRSPSEPENSGLSLAVVGAAIQFALRGQEQQMPRCSTPTHSSAFASYRAAAAADLNFRGSDDDSSSDSDGTLDPHVYRILDPHVYASYNSVTPRVNFGEENVEVDVVGDMNADRELSSSDGSDLSDDNEESAVSIYERACILSQQRPGTDIPDTAAMQHRGNEDMSVDAVPESDLDGNLNGGEHDIDTDCDY
jgi:hypothetical protein